MELLKRQKEKDSVTVNKLDDKKVDEDENEDCMLVDPRRKGSSVTTGRRKEWL